LEFHIHGFIEKLPPSSSYTSILVIVDHLSKQSLVKNGFSNPTKEQGGRDQQ